MEKLKIPIELCEKIWRNIFCSDVIFKQELHLDSFLP